MMFLRERMGRDGDVASLGLGGEGTGGGGFEGRTRRLRRGGGKRERGKDETSLADR